MQPRCASRLGELYFRQGKIHDAEAEWVKVINSGRQDARAYLGIARVRWSIAMYKSGWTMIDKAHTLDPSDPEIQEAWTQKAQPSGDGSSFWKTIWPGTTTKMLTRAPRCSTISNI